MINFYESEDFTRIVYTIEDGEVVEHPLSDLCRDHAEETTSPQGVAHNFHLRGNELWVWGHCGQFPRLVTAFDNEEEANHALLLTFRHELYSRLDNPVVYNTREEAERKLREWLDDEP